MSRRVTSILLSLLIAPVALAQPGSTGAKAPSATVDISVPQRSSLSGEDMLKQGRQYRGDMDKVLAELQIMVDQAKKQKDVIRLNCVMDKVVQVKVNMNIADEAMQRLQQSAGRRDDGASLHEYTRMTIVNQKIQVLQNEGQTCVGVELNYIGATHVEVEAPELPPGATDPNLEPPPIERPPYASNFR